MSNLSHVVLVALAATTFVSGTGAVTAQAASRRVKIVKVKKVRKVAYHATKGNLYSSAKLTHVKYHIKKYPHTTWYSYKKATVKKHGKKASYTYIKAGKKAGWLYSKDLIKGRAAKKATVKTVGTTVKAPAAPVKQVTSKKQQIRNDITAVERAVQNASTETKWLISLSSEFNSADSYEDIAQAIQNYRPDDSDNPTKDELAQNNADRLSITEIYQIFRGRFSASQNSNLDTMDSQLLNTTINENNNTNTAEQISNFSLALSQAVESLD